MPRWMDLAQAGWRMWRLLDWRPIRQQAETPPRFLLLGGGPAAEPVARLLGAGPHLRRGPLQELPAGADPDLVLLAPPSPHESLSLAPQLAREADDRGLAVLLLVPPSSVPIPPGVDYLVVDPAAGDLDDQLAGALIEAVPEDRRLAAARVVPPLRKPLARRLIQEVAFANAQFALVTNLPSLLPGVGTVAAMGADTLVLTTNQVVLVYRLAALWGAPLGDPRALIAEIVPVVGSAFLWRTVARTLVGVLPAFASLAPKVGIAYLGTYLVGGLANTYYAHGLRPSEAQISQIEAEAREALTAAWHRLRPGATDHHPAASLPPAAGPRALSSPALPPAAPNPSAPAAPAAPAPPSPSTSSGPAAPAAPAPPTSSAPPSSPTAPAGPPTSGAPS